MPIPNDELGSGDFNDTYWREVPPALTDLQVRGASQPDLAELRLLADNLPSLCWIADGDGSIGWYNRRWHDYCGSTPEEMSGLGWQSVHDPKILPDVMERWTNCIAVWMRR